MAIQGAEIVAEVKADTDHADRGLDAFHGKLDSGVARFGGWAKAAAMAGTAAAGAFAVKAVMAGSDLMETISKTDAVFKESSGAIQSWAKGAARDFGQSRQEALTAASTFGNLFVQLGTGRDEAGKMSMAMTELASDFASFHNAAPTDVVDAMTAAFRGEYDAVQRYVPTINAAAVEQAALAMTGKATTKELTAQEKALATQKLMMEGAGDATGDFDRTSQGLANRLRIARAAAMDFAANVGMALIPYVLKAWDALEGLAGVLRSAIAPILRTVMLGVQALAAAFRDGDVTSDGFVGIMERVGVVLRNVVHAVKSMVMMFRQGEGNIQGFAEIVDYALGNTGNFVAPIRSLLEAFKPLWGVIERGVEAFGGWGNILKVVGGAIAALLGAAALAGLVSIIGTVVGAVGALVAVFASPIAIIGALAAAVVIAYQRFEGFRNVVNTVMQFITTTILPLVMQFAQFLITQLGNAIAWVVTMWPQIQEAITHVINAVWAVIQTTLTLIMGFWHMFGDDIMAYTGAVFGMIKGIVEATISFIQGFIQTVLAVINGDWGKAWEGIKQMFGAVWDAMVAILQGAWGIIKAAIGAAVQVVQSILSGAWSAIKSVASSMWSGITGAIKGAISGIIDAAKEIPGKIVDVFTGAPKLLVSAGKDIVGGLIEGLKSMAGKLASAIKEFLLDKIPGPVKDFFGIGSPSKLMMGFGGDISEGFAIGITKGGRMVDAAVDKLTSMAEPDLYGGRAASAVGALGSGGMRVGTITFSPVFPGIADGDQAVGALREAMPALVDDLIQELRSR